MTPENTTGKILSRVTQLLQKADEISKKLDAAILQLETLVSQLDDVAARDVYKEIARLESLSEAWDETGKEVAHLLSLLYNQNEHLYEKFDQTMTRIEQDVVILSNAVAKESPSLKDMMLELTDRDNKGVKVSWWTKFVRDTIESWRKNIGLILSCLIVWLLYHVIAQPIVSSLEERLIHRHETHQKTEQ